MATYYLIYQCENANEIGRIIEVNENEVIANVVKDKRYGRADKLNLIVVSGTVYKYYDKVEQYKRVDKWGAGIFSKICALRPGDLCQAEIDRKCVTVKIIDNKLESIEINLKCEIENGDIRDVPANLICDTPIGNENEEGKITISETSVDDARNCGDVQGVSIADGYYILTKKYNTTQPGTLFHVRNGNIMTMPQTLLFMNNDDLKQHLVELEKCEAEFLHKFSIDKRMKRHRQQRFESMKDLSIGQECHLRTDTKFQATYRIQAKYITHDGVKFDLSYGMGSYVFIRGVDAFDIVMGKAFWRNINNRISSRGRRMSKTSGSLHYGRTTGHHKEIVKVEKIFNRIRRVVSNFINPDNICCVEWSESIERWPELANGGKTKCGPNKRPAVCRWIGLVNGKEAIGVEMEDNFGGTSGQFFTFDLFTCRNGYGALFMADDVIHDIGNEKLHFIDDKIVDTTKIYNIRPMNGARECRISIGDPVMIMMHMKSHIGEVRWIGLINHEKCVGLDMEERFDCGMDGIIEEKLIFKCMEGHGLVTPLMNVTLRNDAREPHFMDNGVINPNKYVKCQEKYNKSFFKEKNIKKNDLVYIIITKKDQKIKMKGTLRWCGLMNEMTIGAVELAEDDEHGTDGRFWRHQLFKCPDKRAIAAPWTNIYQYMPYEQKIIPIEDRVFPEIDINSAVKYYLGINDEVKDLYGTIKWSGIDEYGRYLYGLELEERFADGTDGIFKNQRLFQCRPGHGILAPLYCINIDIRFVDFDLTKIYVVS